MNRQIIAGAVVAALMSLSNTAAAAPITLYASLGDDSFLSSGNVTGVFDGSAALPGKYRINSASFFFGFADDQDGLTNSGASYTGSSATGYSYTGYYYDGWNSQYEHHRSVTAYYAVQQFGQQESVSVSLAGIGVGAGATSMQQSSSTSSQYTGYSYDGRSGQGGYYNYYRCGNHTCGGWYSGYYNNYYSNNNNVTTTTTTDWMGAFSVSGTIADQSILTQLMSTSQVQWGLGVTGDLTLTSARLYLDVTELASEVPEPSSLLLTALGMVGLAGWTRRRRAAV